MKALLSVISFILIFSIANASTSMEELSTLSGCWQGNDSNRTYEEQWMQPAGNMMLGMSRTIRDGKVVEFEFLQIQTREDGTFYIANPSKQTRTEFKMKSFDHQQAVFEDPEHDFPQRVIYHLKSDREVTAWIEGLSKGQMKKIEFPMVRVPCPGGK